MTFDRIHILGLALATALGLAACEDDDPVALVPATPTGVAASATGQTITVTWNAVADADDYRVVLSASGETDREQVVTATEATFGQLTADRTYAATVFARNGTGSSGAGGPAVVDTDAEPEAFVNVTSDIVADATWTSDRVWVLTQPVFVGVDCGADGMAAGCQPATLTIEPGTTILGRTDLPQGVRGAYLVVNRGSRIVADANANRADKTARPNADDVIVFTSERDRGDRARGDWGGLVINGRAEINTGDEATGEGDSGLYGGTDNGDDSGILRGVRIEFAGDDVTPADQLNGIAFQGVGSGTIVDYVQIHYNVDDGTEPFGGSVTQTHMVATGVGDDSFDGTDGYRGFMQYLIAQQRGDRADQGFELSNDAGDEAATPRSMAVIANATMVGAGVELGTGEIFAEGGNSDIGLLHREGSYWKVYNSILTGFGETAFCVENPGTALNATARQGGSEDATATLAFEGSIVWADNGQTGGGDTNISACDAASFSTAQTLAFFHDPDHRNMIADPGLPAEAFSIGTQGAPPSFVPSGMPTGYAPVPVAEMITGGLILPADGRTLQDHGWAGAVAPGTAVADAWYAGWTVWSVDGSDSRPGLNELK